MTFLYDDPRTFAADALRGFSQAYARFVRLAPGGVLRAVAAERKVALVIGGGSGHYPAFAGYVGRGLADAAVAGDVFASPSTSSIARLARLAHQGAGILLGFGNYAGDVLNFGAAARRLVSEGIDVRILAVTDDVASAPAETPSLRRGVAGDVAVFKAAGAAAEAGLDVDEVERFARLANSRTFSFGVAYRGCTLPGAREPLFVVPAREMAIGLGIHGEPGVSEGPVVTASELAQVLVERLLRERPADASGRVAVILNGLGGTKYEELFGAWAAIERQLERNGLTAVAPEVGEFVTSLDMAGCSLTLTWLDQGLEELWLAPCESAAFRRGPEIFREVPVPIEDAPAPVAIPRAVAASQESAKCIERALKRIAEAMHSAESRLGDIDAFAGDGDHGFCMSRGSDAASKAATAAARPWRRRGKRPAARRGRLGRSSGRRFGRSLGGRPARLGRCFLRRRSGHGGRRRQGRTYGARRGDEPRGRADRRQDAGRRVRTLCRNPRARGRGRPKPRRGVALGGGRRFRRRDRHRSARPEARPGAAPGGEERRPSGPGRDLLGIVRAGGRRGPALVLALRRREAPSNLV